jgi:multidrug efflux pump subunit AcrB
LYLSQVARIIDGEKEETSIARINGRPSIVLDTLKAQDANIVETGRGIREAVAALKAMLPPDVELSIAQSTAETVERSVSRVKQTIAEGALLTVLIVLLFLGSWRSTIITGLTLPIAVIATFIALHAFGKDPVQAAREGTDEIGLAVMATTFAIVAVFVPIAFMSGIIGRFLFQFGVTVAVAVLVSLFASFTQPVAIMASLPFALIGVFVALLLTGTTLNPFSIIGFIMLMGLVTKNAILLVDFANRARRGGASLEDALYEAGQVRLRPIVMTTAAMIGGMLPLALGLGQGAETQAPMGRAIIGGVVTSTLLTLLVVPALYAYLDARHERRAARRAAAVAAAESVRAAPVRADQSDSTCDNRRTDLG